MQRAIFLGEWESLRSRFSREFFHHSPSHLMASYLHLTGVETFLSWLHRSSLHAKNAHNDMIYMAGLVIGKILNPLAPSRFPRLLLIWGVNQKRSSEVRAWRKRELKIPTTNFARRRERSNPRSMIKWESDYVNHARKEPRPDVVEWYRREKWPDLWPNETLNEC